MTLETLKNGTAVTLRQPTMDDLDRLRGFFLGLPEEDRKYLRVDVSKREVVEQLIRQGETGEVHRIIALIGEDVIANGGLHRSTDTWQRHLGEIRVIVARQHRGQRLGAMLIGELFHTAEKGGIEQVVVKAAAPQTAARKICDRLGFRVDAVLPDHIKDPDGNLHDMVVMSCTLDEMWHELKDFYKADDWPDG
ncbi:MAG: GNAT family N-acetyltransferase [Planctomycetota bacterium]